MITKIKGIIDFVGSGFVVVDVSGIGYKIHTNIETMRLLSRKKNEEESLWIYQAVRENSLDLYGFLEYAELEFFELLITISGIGPKSALGVLNVAPIDTLRQAVSSGDTVYLTKVSGIGKKIAEKIVLELRDKLGAIDMTHKESGNMKEESDTLDALIALGYSQAEAREALKNINENIVGTNEKVKAALKDLGNT
jgi:Holliday junction DNA helicase RuvA